MKRRTGELRTAVKADLDGNSSWDWYEPADVTPVKFPYGVVASATTANFSRTEMDGADTRIGLLFFARTVSDLETEMSATVDRFDDKQFTLSGGTNFCTMFDGDDTFEETRGTDRIMRGVQFWRCLTVD